MGFITYQSVAGDPIVVEAEDRWVEIVTELDRQEYNNEHAYHRQDRKGVRFCSWEVYNAYDSQKAGASPSPEDIVCDKETIEEKENAIRVVGEILLDAIVNLPQVQRSVVIAVLIEGRPAVEVAAERGVSKAAISKTLKKAKKRLRQALIAVGVNSADISGLLLSEAQGSAQKGTK